MPVSKDARPLGTANEHDRKELYPVHRRSPGIRCAASCDSGAFRDAKGLDAARGARRGQDRGLVLSDTDTLLPVSPNVHLTP